MPRGSDRTLPLGSLNIMLERTVKPFEEPKLPQFQAHPRGFCANIDILPSIHEN